MVRCVCVQGRAVCVWQGMVKGREGKVPVAGQAMVLLLQCASLHAMFFQSCMFFFSSLQHNYSFMFHLLVSGR